MQLLSDTHENVSDLHVVQIPEKVFDKVHEVCLANAIVWDRHVDVRVWL